MNNKTIDDVLQLAYHTKHEEVDITTVKGRLKIEDVTGIHNVCNSQEMSRAYSSGEVYFSFSVPRYCMFNTESRILVVRDNPP